MFGTKPSAADYDPADGSDLSGLGYAQVDVGDPDAIEAAALPFDTLDVLVLCQGTVVYKRGEFERPGWDRVMAVNPVDLRTTREVILVSGGWQKLRAITAALKLLRPSVLIVNELVADRLVLASPKGLAA